MQVGEGGQCRRVVERRGVGMKILSQLRGDVATIRCGGIVGSLRSLESAEAESEATNRISDLKASLALAQQRVVELELQVS